MSFTTRDEYKAMVVAALGEYADDHDVDGIVDGTAVADPVRGYVQGVDTETFWEVVQRNAG